MASVRLVHVSGRIYRTYEAPQGPKASSTEKVLPRAEAVIELSRPVVRGLGAEFVEQLAKATSTRIVCTTNTATTRFAISAEEEDRVRLASTVLQNAHAARLPKPTHFISIPLNLTGCLTEVFREFKRDALELAAGLDDSAFMPAVKLHLTVAVTNLAAVEDKAAMLEILTRRLERAKIFDVELAGLAVIKGTVKECAVLYARVSPQKQLDALFKPLVEEMACKGLTATLAIKWHCTLINIKYSTPQPGRPFDASRLMERWGERPFGTVRCNQVHLSLLGGGVDGSSGYYRHEKTCWLQP